MDFRSFPTKTFPTQPVMPGASMHGAHVRNFHMNASDSTSSSVGRINASRFLSIVLHLYYLTALQGFL